MARRSDEDEGIVDSDFVYEESGKPRLESDVLVTEFHKTADSDDRSTLSVSSTSTVFDSEIVFGPSLRRMEGAEEENEIVFCTDDDYLKELAGKWDSSEGSVVEVEKFLCRSTLEFHEQMELIEPGDFRLYPLGGSVEITAQNLKNPDLKRDFAIGYKTPSGELVRFDVASTTSDGRKLFYVESVDSESPLFPSIASLLTFYAMNSGYLSLRLKQFIRFPIGSVMKKERAKSQMVLNK
ncbi:hypothetical protein QR680_008841 [Steinernema hermaphroditum]|uniref:Uncharacterized protein n=1 Tax=Steinernema hermaphroditum TaxID=289476 RepID=A0AA39IKF1_9BILA|nr:hypothetical protein QR680_008841 [Steinernema hermaphroditum]